MDVVRSGSRAKGFWGQLTERGVDHDLHGNLGGRVDGVVGVGLVSRVHAAGEGIARGFERRLRDRVVLAQEGEDERVTDGGPENLGVEGETLGSANGNAVGGTGAGSHGSASTAAGDDRGRGGHLAGAAGHRRSGSGASNGLGDGDGLGLVEDGRRLAASEVDPEEVDRDTASRCKAQQALQALEIDGRRRDAVDGGHVPLCYRSDIMNRLRRREMGHAQRQGRRELHGDDVWWCLLLSSRFLFVLVVYPTGCWCKKGRKPASPCSIEVK